MNLPEVAHPYTNVCNPVAASEVAEVVEEEDREEDEEEVDPDYDRP